jgi:hypothetical protein
MAYSRTQRVDIFAQEIVQGSKQSDAYRKAFPQARKWKGNTVWSRACDFAKDSEVVARIAQLKERMVEKHDITIAGILKPLLDQANYNPANLFDEHGKQKPFNEIKDSLAVMNVKLKAGPMGTQELELSFNNSDRNKAIQLLGAAMPFWNKENNVPAPAMFNPPKELPPPPPMDADDVDERRLARLIALLLVAEDYEGAKA